MSKIIVFTTVTALPTSITRQSVLETLHDNIAIIDLNPLVEQRYFIKSPKTLLLKNIPTDSTR